MNSYTPLVSRTNRTVPTETITFVLIGEISEQVCAFVYSFVA